MKSVQLPVAVVCLGTLVACQADEEPASASAPVAPVDAVWELTEDLRIGALDGPPELTFASIAGLEVDDYGRIWVLDSQAGELRVFDSDGSHLRTIGREGQGPGEFQRPSALARHPDGTMWVIDSGRKVYSVFDTTGAIAATHPRPLSNSVPVRSDDFTRQGRLFEVEATFRESGVEYFLALVEPETGRIDSIPLPRFTREEYEVEVASGGGVARYMSVVPFTSILVWHTDEDGTLWYGATSPYRIVRTALEGDTIGVVERSYEPVPVQPGEREAAIEELQGIRDMGARIDEGRIPSVKPAFRHFLVDDEEHLWVVPVQPADSAEVEGPTLFEIFDPKGRYLGSAQSPVPLLFRQENPHLHPFLRDGYLYGVTTGELGEQSVVRLRVAGR